MHIILKYETVILKPIVFLSFHVKKGLLLDKNGSYQTVQKKIG